MDLSAVCARRLTLRVIDRVNQSACNQSTLLWSYLLDVPTALSCPQVLTAVVRLLGSLMQQSNRCAAAVASRLMDRCLQLAVECGSGSGNGAAGGSYGAAASAATAALAGQRLDACLHFATQLVSLGAGGGAAPAAAPPLPTDAALLLCMPRLLPLARLGRSSTRRQMLELCSALLPAARLLQQAAEARAAAGGEAAVQPTAAGGGQACPGPAPAYQAALLAALCSGTSDRDATLRAKALGCLERHAQLLADKLGSSGAAAADAAATGAVAGAAGSLHGSSSSSGERDVSGPLLQALCGRCVGLRLCVSGCSGQRAGLQEGRAFLATGLLSTTWHIQQPITCDHPAPALISSTACWSAGCWTRVPACASGPCRCWAPSPCTCSSSSGSSPAGRLLPGWQRQYCRWPASCWGCALTQPCTREMRESR